MQKPTNFANFKFVFKMFSCFKGDAVMVCAEFLEGTVCEIQLAAGSRERRSHLQAWHRALGITSSKWWIATANLSDGDFSIASEAEMDRLSVVYHRAKAGHEDICDAEIIRRIRDFNVPGNRHLDAFDAEALRRQILGLLQVAEVNSARAAFG